MSRALVILSVVTLYAGWAATAAAQNRPTPPAWAYPTNPPAPAGGGGGGGGGGGAQAAPDETPEPRKGSPHLGFEA